MITNRLPYRSERGRSGIRSIVKEWLAGGLTEPPALTPASFSGPVLPESDAPDSISGPDPEPWVLTRGFDPLEGRAFIIVYVDANDAESERRIVADVCYEAGGLVYLKALCLERRAKRLFRVDRIEGVFCGVTGEDLGSPAWIFVPTERRASAKSKADHKTPANARRGSAAGRYPEVRKVLGLLVTLARADGIVHPNERRMLVGFVEQTLPEDIPNSDVDELVEWAWRQAPGLERFLDGTAFAFQEQPQWALSLLAAATDMVEADGRITPEEREWMDELAILARACGVS